MGCTQSSSANATEPKAVPVNNDGGEKVNAPEPTTANPVKEEPTKVEEQSEKKGHVDAFGNLVDETGARIWSDAYYAARKEADEHAHLRGKCFEESKKAFEEDRKAEAKTLSEEGKKHGHLMGKPLMLS